MAGRPPPPPGQAYPMQYYQPRPGQPPPQQFYGQPQGYPPNAMLGSPPPSGPPIGSPPPGNQMIRRPMMQQGPPPPPPQGQPVILMHMPQQQNQQCTRILLPQGYHQQQQQPRQIYQMPQQQQQQPQGPPPPQAAPRLVHMTPSPSSRPSPAPPISTPTSMTVDNGMVMDITGLDDLVASVDPNEQLDEDVKEALLQLADQFVDKLIDDSCKIAQHRKSTTLEVKDVQLCLDRNYQMWVPGFGRDEQRPYKKSSVTEAHKQRMALIRKTLKKV